MCALKEQSLLFDLFKAFFIRSKAITNWISFSEKAYFPSWAPTMFWVTIWYKYHGSWCVKLCGNWICKIKITFMIVFPLGKCKEYRYNERWNKCLNERYVYCPCFWFLCVYSCIFWPKIGILFLFGRISNIINTLENLSPPCVLRNTGIH